LSSCGPRDPTMQGPTVLFEIHGQSNPGWMTENIRLDNWHLMTQHWTIIWQTQSMDADDWWDITEDLRLSKKDRGTARLIESCQLHNPNGLPLPWLTTQGTLCRKTQMLYQMVCIATGGSWIVERFSWLGEGWHQPKLTNTPTAIIHQMLGHLQTWYWWILRNHRNCMALGNPKGSMKPSNPECTGIPGWISIHMDGNTCGQC
jgi:hypothetical protein